MKKMIMGALAVIGLVSIRSQAMPVTQVTLRMAHDSFVLQSSRPVPDLVLYMNEAVLDYIDGLRHPSEQGIILYQCEAKMRDSILPITHPQGSIRDPKRIRQVFEVGNCTED